MLRPPFFKAQPAAGGAWGQGGGVLALPPAAGTVKTKAGGGVLALPLARGSAKTRSPWQGGARKRAPPGKGERQTGAGGSPQSEKQQVQGMKAAPLHA